MKTTAISWKIEDDGTVSIDTGDLSGPNHLAADELLKELAEVLGGPVTIKAKSKFIHTHADLGAALRQHAADGHTHQ